MHHLLSNVYSDETPSERTCRDWTLSKLWF